MLGSTKHHHTSLKAFWVGRNEAFCQPLLNDTSMSTEHSFLEHPNEEAPMLLEDLLEVQIQSSTAPYPGSGTEPNLMYQDPQKPKTFSGIITLGVPCTYLNNAFFMGKSLKNSHTNLHCLIPPYLGNLMIPGFAQTKTRL